MKKLSFEEISQQRLSLEALRKLDRFPIQVVLDNIRSLYNVGAIFRTADGARIERLFLTGITGTPPRKEIDKTALGAVESVPWEYHREAGRVVTKLKQAGIPIVALEHTNNSVSYKEVQFKYPLCLVLGNEVFGIQDRLVEMADIAIEIPMFGIKQSLNVSVAFGIVVYEMIFQYLSKNQKLLVNTKLKDSFQ